MGIIRGFKNIVKNAIGVEQIKSQTASLKNLAEDLLKPKQSTHQETFEEALVRLNLTEADVQKKAIEFKRLSTIFGFLAVALLAYLIYMIFEKALVASLGTFGVLLVIMGQWFRCHFWLYQIRARKLGCSFKDWLREGLGVKV